jgi:glyoxylase-like metal-dependent hydrolase (beta-lactamase superfamily II)
VKNAVNGDAPAPPEPKLKLQIFTSSQEGFLVTSTLVAGATEAVLIDAQFTLGDARKLAEMVKASNKKLTSVYVTHAHPDHYFGFAAVKEAALDIVLKIGAETAFEKGAKPKPAPAPLAKPAPAATK